MSIVEKMEAAYRQMVCARPVGAGDSNTYTVEPPTRERFRKAVITATGLTEQQLEGLAKGDLVIVSNPFLQWENAVEAHPIDDIVTRAKAAAEKAAVKFPQPNYVSLKIAEEAGEVVRGCVHYAEKRMEWAEVEGEIVQLIAMLIRLVTEGDQINGVFPPRAMLAAKEG